MYILNYWKCFTFKLCYCFCFSMLRDKTALTINKDTSVSFLAMPDTITLTDEERDVAIDKSFTPIIPIAEAASATKGSRISISGKIIKVCHFQTILFITT